MTIICLIILFTTWSFSFLNAIRISKVPGHYINHKKFNTAGIEPTFLKFVGAGLIPIINSFKIG